MSQTITLAEIEALTKTLAAARDLVSERVTALHAEMESAKNRKLPGIKTAVAAAKEAGAALEAALKSAPQLFTEPRTIIAHGLKVGYAKGRGKITWADEATVIDRIEKKLPDQKELLVKTTKELRKKALGALSTEDLRRVGCTLLAAGDHVYIQPVADDVDKLVTRLLKEESAEEATAAAA